MPSLSRLAPALSVTLLSVVLLSGCGSAPVSETPERGSVALKHVQQLTQNIGARVQGTPAEAQARDYIAAELRAAGYQPQLDYFEVTRTNRAGATQQALSGNVMAVKEGRSEEEITVVAHLDSVGVGVGADDNAPGVGVMLEAAAALHGQDVPYTVRFLAVGAEEG
ncbi:Zn-dependent exopeptidase M28 [Deinococcus radiophilus]|uniref:Zn-dependent exopeptidase M28 n=1 Tax=Deinococcus radiophilus TaxID=32062 RepID=A0A3S0IRF6_9DEIO|nr:Zn-dependent exopeptidase M28 [Deinococcus radiophilus]